VFASLKLYQLIIEQTGSQVAGVISLISLEILPYFQSREGNQTSNSTSSFLSFGESSGSSAKENQTTFETSRIQLEQRISTVIQGLSRVGLRAQKLGTEEVVELFYKLFNPSEQNREAPKVSQL
jgi:hypothetical protein